MEKTEKTAKRKSQDAEESVRRWAIEVKRRAWPYTIPPLFHQLNWRPLLCVL